MTRDTDPMTQPSQAPAAAGQDLARLPRWARWEIDRLRKDVATLEEELGAALGRNPTRVIVDRYSDAPRYLVERETVSYLVADDTWIDVRFEGDGAVSIFGQSMQDRTFTVLPQASNKIEVRMVAERIRPDQRTTGPDHE